MKIFDNLIIGAGPAGLQLAYFLQQKGRDYQVLEKGPKAGDFFTHFPRHGQLISINKIYTGYDDPEVNLRWDWNSLLTDDHELPFAHFSEDYFPEAASMVNYLNAFVEKYSLAVQYHSEVQSIEKEGDVFRLQTQSGKTFHCHRLIVATGTFLPYVPDIPGIELCDTYVNCSIDRKDYRNKRVLIVGKGNSGFEIADDLVNAAAVIHVLSPSPVKLAWQTHFVGDLRAVNNNLLDTYQLKSQNALLDASIKEIRQEEGQFKVKVTYTHAHGEEEELVYDKVIVATGWKFDGSMFRDDLQPDLDIDMRFPRQSSEWESTNIPHLYFAGSLTQQRDFKASTSAFIHGFRYNAKSLFQLLEQKYHDVALPKTPLPFSLSALTDQLIDRINRNSALWQQYGFLADVLVLPQSEEELVPYFEALPKEYILERADWQTESLLLLTMEYGQCEAEQNVFAIERKNEANHAADSVFLHPILYYYERGVLQATFHLIEDLEARWVHPERHIAPLQSFLTKVMRQVLHGETVNIS